MSLTQLSVFDLTSSIPSTPDNIIQFPTQSTPKKPHTQQRVSPLRDPALVNRIYQALLASSRHGLRNASIFALQLAIGRRTNDILRTTIKTVYDFSTNSIRPMITVDEHKTGKTARDLPLNTQTQQILLKYIHTLKAFTPDALLFPSQKKNPDGTQRPLNTSSLDGIYKQIDSLIDTHISSYAPRKTYGYNIYTECMKNHNGLLPGTDISALQYVQSVFNHESTSITLRYIGAYDAPATELSESISQQYDFCHLEE